MYPRACRGLLLLASASLLVAIPARADIAVLMLEATGTGAARYTAGGHSAVYLSGVCQESPIKVRLCDPGEAGSVVSNYMDFGEESSPEWNAAPAAVFFYGVEDAADAPLYGDPELLGLLRDRYREKYLAAVCPAGVPCASGHGHWIDMVGATFSRDIYAFSVHTTREQDEQIVEDLNSLPNVNHYSGFTRNCADFTRLLINKYFPGSARADRLNDFGMTSPKAVARSFAHYGRRHPELGYTVQRFTQIPGPIRRSLDNRNGTEVGFRAKKWSFPLLVLRSHALIYFAASYYLTAWFNPEHEFQHHRNPASHVPHAVWSAYRQRFSEVLLQAVRDGVFSDKKDADRYFRLLGTEGRKEVDEKGMPVLRLGRSQVGLTRASLVQADADSRLMAERLLLSRLHASLKARSKNRPPLEEIQKDWSDLETLMRLRQIEASSPGTAASSRIAGQ